jgi:hypothetical protein
VCILTALVRNSRWVCVRGLLRGVGLDTPSPVDLGLRPDFFELALWSRLEAAASKLLEVEERHLI